MGEKQKREGGFGVGGCNIFFGVYHFVITLLVSFLLVLVTWIVHFGFFGILVFDFLLVVGVLGCHWKEGFGKQANT